MGFYDDEIEDKLTNNISISEGVKEVTLGSYMNRKITGISLPNSLEKIGSYAFANNRIESLEIPKTVKKIGNYAFSVNNIKEVILPEGLEEISAGLFYRNDIESIILPSTLRIIGERAFKHNKLTMVSLPKGIISIGTEAFCNTDIEYDGILITNKELSNIGCENIISYAKNKKKTLIEENIIEDDNKELFIRNIMKISKEQGIILEINHIKSSINLLLSEIDEKQKNRKEYEDYLKDINDTQEELRKNTPNVDKKLYDFAIESCVHAELETNLCIGKISIEISELQRKLKEQRKNLSEIELRLKEIISIESKNFKNVNNNQRRGKI